MKNQIIKRSWVNKDIIVNKNKLKIIKYLMNKLYIKIKLIFKIMNNWNHLNKNNIFEKNYK